MIKNFCVYSITNLLNNKIYIGKTKANTTRRWTDHIRTSKDLSLEKQYIHRAIEKYGVDNFEFKIIEYYEFEKDAYEAEITYIKQYNSYGDGGYNETAGGPSCGGVNKKICSEKALSLIKDYLDGNFTSKSLSKKYNLAKPSVLDILNRRSYLEVDLDDEIKYQLWLKLNRNFQDEISHENCNF